MTYCEVIDAWQTSSSFREFFSDSIRQCPFEAYFWETPPVTRHTLNRTFEFVLVAGLPLLALTPDPLPFRPLFAARRSETVLTFPNLGGDAVLVVLAPLVDADCHAHLARFLEGAPGAQIDAFWRTTGRALQDQLSDVPVWLSTSGLGVAWLHLRLDSRPK
jgi:hypothetical protein